MRRVSCAACRVPGVHISEHTLTSAGRWRRDPALQEKLPLAQQRMEQLSQQIRDVSEKENALADEEGPLNRRMHETKNAMQPIEAELKSLRDPMHVFKVSCGLEPRARLLRRIR